MDNFLTRAIKKDPKSYAIIGIIGGFALGFLAFTDIIHNVIGGFIGGFFLGIGMTAVQYWYYDKQHEKNN